jgi:hypothetical protein
MVFAGAALATLVAVAERARRGEPSVLLHTGGAWGGYFGGIEAGGERWDAGVVLHEFTSMRTPAAPPPLSDYHPERRNDVGRHFGAVRDWVRSRQPVHDIAPPQMWCEGAWRPDLITANALPALASLPCAAAARAELRARLPELVASPWHPRHKGRWTAAGVPSWEALSRLNHGDVLHEAVFEPFARRVLGEALPRLSGLYHRIAWLPLYWPETLLAALQGGAPALPPTVFAHPTGEPVAALVTRLVREIEASPLVQVRRVSIEGVRRERGGFRIEAREAPAVAGGPSCASGPSAPSSPSGAAITLHADRFAWALPPRAGLAAAGLAHTVPEGPPEPRAPLELLFTRLPRAALKREFTVAHVAAAGAPGCAVGSVYRVTDVTACARAGRGAPAAVGGDDLVRLCLERRPGAPGAPPAAEADAVRSMLDDAARIGLLHEGAHEGAEPRFAKRLHAPAALALPTREALAQGAAERAALAAAWPGAAFLAMAAGPFVHSLADQIVQGLALAEAAGGADTALPATAESALALAA